MVKKDIRRYSLEELKARRKSGKTRTRPDAPEIELGEDFWQNGRGVAGRKGQELGQPQARYDSAKHRLNFIRAFRMAFREGNCKSGKHGVSFEEATSVFGDPLATTISDPHHSAGEQRFLSTGLSSQQRVVIVWHTDHNDAIRIIGARVATPRERRIYESGE